MVRAGVCLEHGDLLTTRTRVPCRKELICAAEKISYPGGCNWKCRCLEVASPHCRTAENPWGDHRERQGQKETERGAQHSPFDQEIILCPPKPLFLVKPCAAELEVKVVTTERAKHFYNAQEIPVTLYSDEDEWQLWKGRSDPVLHIELRRWADLMLVAPLDANTLAKLANGICDNLLTCVIRAWDLSKPLLFCPAMNTAMWEHPITAQQVEQLKGFGYTEIPCVVKKLVCGDEALSLLQELLPRFKLVQIQDSFL
ncbi:phosphopantothenoylcysteine decarboxylase isoform X3 [Egretta garzetta]|uniref:phosphopantothenoylcysteine decarboxylase isoform X3 n=1 Tax=Egretta garzetta TaxID=188379 RepID=UPI00163C8684|nr:phosphopantothenoylcysteine decarboxylase isoform X3 [Egretta garzetta]